MKGNELKPNIGLFGRRNYGKSSLINFLTGQPISIVSAEAGTTTDPVRKTMEIGGIGPVVWVDTAGIDDEGALGRLRVEKTLRVLPSVDLALILFTNNIFDLEEKQLVSACQREEIPFLIVCTQTDRVEPDARLLEYLADTYGAERICKVSTRDERTRLSLCEKIKEALPQTAYVMPSLLGDVLKGGEVVVLVTPIDSSAPEGRMILPQVQVLRDILDNDAEAMFCKPEQLEQTLGKLGGKPDLVITDSQAFAIVAEMVPRSVPLTSFSVVLARQKGLFDEYLKGTPQISQLKDGDRVLLMESCTHNVTCEDIGRVKIPNLLRKRTGKDLQFEVLAGSALPSRPMTEYSLAIQCGGCVVTHRQLVSRLQMALDAGVPVSNYGLTLAYLNGIFGRAIEIFKKQER